ncbi:hypothetical protein B7R74_15510 [Yersinia pseudotuberculosis]|nr:hypothetical protein B7R74_15510 [Yersinia pseudotuberculosis]
MVFINFPESVSAPKWFMLLQFDNLINFSTVFKSFTRIYAQYIIGKPKVKGICNSLLFVMIFNR